MTGKNSAQVQLKSNSFAKILYLLLLESTDAEVLHPESCMYIKVLLSISRGEANPDRLGSKVMRRYFA